MALTYHKFTSSSLAPCAHRNPYRGHKDTDGSELFERKTYCVPRLPDYQERSSSQWEVVQCV
ncbi:hypothetical protein WG66_006322 [Moniliophthora roreri]|nr:hypothetical protein WG66_006322 [Moniliophthora roreri]